MGLTDTHRGTYATQFYKSFFKKVEIHNVPLMSSGIRWKSWKSYLRETTSNFSYVYVQRSSMIQETFKDVWSCLVITFCCIWRWNDIFFQIKATWMRTVIRSDPDYRIVVRLQIKSIQYLHWEIINNRSKVRSCIEVVFNFRLQKLI